MDLHVDQPRAARGGVLADTRPIGTPPTSPASSSRTGSPEWFSNVTHRDTALGTVWEAAPNGDYYLMPTRRFFSAIASYVTGSHNLKFGVQDQFGFLEQGTTLNGALHQVYLNTAPVSVSIYNTPERDRYTMKAQWGLFAQDTWTFKRMTVNAGLRWDYFSSEIASQESGQGRFVPQRIYGPEPMPVWNTLSPRLGLTYDLFGNGKTAVKFSVNRYQLGATDGIAADYNPMRLQSATVDWRDLNGDDIATGAPGCSFLTGDCEINFAQLPANFGLIRGGLPGDLLAGLHPLRHRPGGPGHQARLRVGVEPRRPARAVPSRLGVGQLVLYALLQPPAAVEPLRTFADYTPVEIASPLDGSVVTMYNVSPAKLSAVRNLNSNDPEAKRWNHAFEFGLQRPAARRRDGVRRWRGGPHHAGAMRLRRRSQPVALL